MLSILSKVFETVVYWQVSILNDLLNSAQSGYHSGYRTQDVLSQVPEITLRQQSDLVSIVFIDLRKVLLIIHYWLLNSRLNWQLMGFAMV